MKASPLTITLSIALGAAGALAAQHLPALLPVAVAETAPAVAMAPITVPELPTAPAPVLSPTARRGAEYRETFGIDWVTFAWIEQPESTPWRRVHRTVSEVHFADGRVLTNPSVIAGDFVDHSEHFSETDISIYRSIRAYNDETAE